MKTIPSTCSLICLTPYPHQTIQKIHKMSGPLSWGYGECRGRSAKFRMSVTTRALVLALWRKFVVP